VLGAATIVGGCNSLLDNRRAKLDPAALTEGEHAGMEDAAAPSVDTTRPPAECPTGTRSCDGVCVATGDPAYGCGDPSCRPCASEHASAACHGGECALASCDRGYADCNGDARDGCEVDLSKPESCGRCAETCSAEAPLCAPTGAGFECTSGCPEAAPDRCGGDCVSLLTSANHCGGCDEKCAAVANAQVECADGGCTFTCKAGYHACGAACAVDSDPKQCGPACTACPSPANATATCEANACAIRCASGHADCNGDAKDGCEVKLATDPLNCGGCGESCKGGACELGACVPVQVRVDP
jgi:hypothetical protein